jgi:hypothetical protein
MDKRHLKIAVKIVISSLFIGYLIFKVDVVAMVAVVGNIDVGFYGTSTLLTIFSGIVVAAKHYCLVKGSIINHSLARLVRINFIARFYALFLPSALGREVVRWIKVTHHSKGKVQFLAAIVLERLTFLFVLLLCGLIPLFFYTSNSGIENLRVRILPIAAIGLLAVSLAMMFYIFPPLRAWIQSWATAILHRIRPNLDVAAYFEDHQFNKIDVNTLAFILGLSIFWQIFFILRLLFLVKAASVPLGIIDITWIGSLVLLLQTIPISFAGLGLREGAYAYLFTLFHLSPEKGVLIGILFFTQMLIVALVGGVLEFFE